MGFCDSLSGTVWLEVTSADTAALLTAITASHFTVLRVKAVDVLTVIILLDRRDLFDFLTLLSKRGETYKIIKRSGIYWTATSLLRRPFVLTAIVLLVVMAIYLPSRIFFVHVEGNYTIPDNMIIEAASECGIRFGALRRQVRSEKVKNMLIEEIPQLQWIGVNTSGCVATIEVREKSIHQQQPKEAAISGIVALRDGVICDVTVTKGNPVCKVGDVVRAGQTLISPYTDYGIVIKATQAKGEIYAQTNRQVTVVSPTPNAVRGQILTIKKKYSVKIGKKLINFSKDSGISDACCVKMYEQKFLTLPGDFVLPMSIICQTSIQYSTNSDVPARASDYGWMEGFCNDYLQDQMIAGKILDVEYRENSYDNAYYLQADFSCVEMIGMSKNEESIQRNGENS